MAKRPEKPTAAIDHLYLLYNLLLDDEGAGKADLTLVEAAFTAIPYLSWSEVLNRRPTYENRLWAGRTCLDREAG